MELLQLLLYTTAFSQLSYSAFFDFCLVNMFLKYAYNFKPSYVHNQNTIDFTTFLITFAHLTLHIIQYYVFVLSQKCYTYKCGKYIIDNYNILNKRYLNIRFKFIYYTFLTPLKFIFKKFVIGDIPEHDINEFKKIIELNFENNNIKKQNNFNEIEHELKTNKQIDSFLDKILLENNKNK